MAVLSLAESSYTCYTTKATAKVISVGKALIIRHLPLSYFYTTNV